MLRICCSKMEHVWIIRPSFNGQSVAERVRRRWAGRTGQNGHTHASSPRAVRSDDSRHSTVSPGTQCPGTPWPDTGHPLQGHLKPELVNLTNPRMRDVTITSAMPACYVPLTPAFVTQEQHLGRVPATMAGKPGVPGCSRGHPPPWSRQSVTAAAVRGGGQGGVGATPTLAITPLTNCGKFLVIFFLLDKRIFFWYTFAHDRANPDSGCRAD